MYIEEVDPTPANDAELTVLDVIEEENHETIQQSECIHSIPVIEITDTNSEVYNASGVIYPPTTTGPGAPVKLKMMINSSNRVYNLVWDPVQDNSTGFSVGDIILIKGSVLTGNDGVNDLKIVVTGFVSGGKIGTLQINPAKTFVARGPRTYDFDIIRKVNSPDYSHGASIAKIEDCKVGDTFDILGSKLDGADGINNLRLTVKSLQHDDNY